MRRIGTALLVCLLFAGTGYGQSPPAAAPQANTQTVDAAKSGPQATPLETMLSSNANRLSQAAASLTTDFASVVAAIPKLPGKLSAFADRVVDPAQGPFVAWVLRLVATFVIAFGGLKLVRLLLLGQRRKLVAGPMQITSVLGVAAIDALGVIALAIVAFAGRTLWFFDGLIRSDLAVSLLAALVYWQATLLMVDLVLRPHEPAMRLVDLADKSTTHLHQMARWLIGLQVFSIEVLRAFFQAGFDLPSLQVMAIPVGVVNALVAFVLIRRVKTSFDAAPSDTVVGMHHLPTHRLLAGSWYPITIVFLIAALLAWVFGILIADLSVFWGLIETAAIVLGAWVAETVIRIWLQQAAHHGVDTPGAVPRVSDRWSLLIGRCLAIGVWLVALVAPVRLWLVDLFGIISVERWDGYRNSALSALGTLFAAYVIIQAVFMYTDHRFKLSSAWDPDDAEQRGRPPPIESRLQTMLPLLRFFILGAILVLAILIALSELGINTTSLVAGASIFGLAISFGSQTLVRDIVSGIFFMADDAFRVGEYIDTGRLKGTVEGMSIRSIRLRHQNGQVHVIPFGQIQHVTNFSRDWTTVKFNLRLMHGTDLEKVRKTIKQIGVEMMDDPEIAPEIIAPLKLQGVADIDPSAIIVRLKFTARPAQPTFVYRRALLRLYTRFQEERIELANTNVVVETKIGKTSSEDAVEIAAAGAAATQVRVASGRQ